jgi:hypothetical protein
MTKKCRSSSIYIYAGAHGGSQGGLGAGCLLPCCQGARVARVGGAGTRGWGGLGGPALRQHSVTDVTGHLLDRGPGHRTVTRLPPFTGVTDFTRAPACTRATGPDCYQVGLNAGVIAFSYHGPSRDRQTLLQSGPPGTRATRLGVTFLTRSYQDFTGTCLLFGLASGLS